MLVVMLLALGGASVASAGAELEHLPHDRVVDPRLAKADVRGRVANVGAIEAEADALGHVDGFRRAGVGAAAAHLGAVHHVVHRIAKRLVDVPVHVRVQARSFCGWTWGILLS